MFEFIDLAISMQKRVIDAHEKSLDAARKSAKGVDAMIAMQKAMTDASKAQLDAWDEWLGIWGLRK
jgi:hypothetical protein